MTPREQADAIIAALMTNGNGDKARRLVLELPDGSDGGGWSEQGAWWAVMDILEPGTRLESALSESDKV